jgi:hypothetical protein
MTGGVRVLKHRPASSRGPANVRPEAWTALHQFDGGSLAGKDPSPHSSTMSTGPVLTSLSSFIVRVVSTQSACAPEGCDSALAAAVVRQESGVEEGDKPMPSLSIAMVRDQSDGKVLGSCAPTTSGRTLCRASDSVAS